MAGISVTAPMVAVLPTSSGASQPMPTPSDLKTISREDAPAYEDLINFPRARDKEQAQCVMCGRRPGASVVIPRQNKDVCKDCDRQIWQHGKTLVYFKWCKGCKRFLNLVRFGDRLTAAKCEKCRHRARQSYMAKKTKTGLKPGDEHGKLGDVAAAGNPGFIPSKPKPDPLSGRTPNPFDAPTFTSMLAANPQIVVPHQVLPGLRLARPTATLGPLDKIQQMGSRPTNNPTKKRHVQPSYAPQKVSLQKRPFDREETKAKAPPAVAGGVGSILKMELETQKAANPQPQVPNLPYAPTSAAMPIKQDDQLITDPGYNKGGLGLSRTPRSFNAGSYEVNNMKRHRIGSISRRLRSASDLEETGIINRKQKGVLKDLLISGDEQLQQALDKFENGETSALEAIITSGTLDYPASMDLLDGFEMDFDGLFATGEENTVRDEWPQPSIDVFGTRGGRTAGPLTEDFSEGQLFAMDDVDLGDRRGSSQGMNRHLSIGSLSEDPLAGAAGARTGERKGSFASSLERKFSFTTPGSLGMPSSFFLGSGSIDSLGGLGLSGPPLGSLTGDDVALMQPEEAAANLGV